NIEIPPAGQKGWSNFTCQLHQDNHPSFGINLDTGQWNCFAGCNGGDLYSFEMKLGNCDFPSAKKVIHDLLGIKPRLVAEYRYTNDSGELLYVKERWEEAGHKS